MMKKLVAVALASAGLIVHAEFAVTSVRGSGKTVYGLSVSFDATDEDRLLFCASGATDGGDDLNAWDDFFRVSVPAGATSAEVACPAPIDMTSSKVRFFFAPTTVTAYDALLESVEATGAQYIDTGVYASGPKTAAHAKFAYSAESKTDQVLFGARSDDSDTLAFHFSFQVNSGNWFAFNCKDLIHNNGTDKKPTAGAIYTVTLDSPNRLALVQDNAGADFYRYTIPSEWPHVRTATRTMLVFADHGYGTPRGFASARLYALDICEDGEKVRDYTPAVCGGAVGLYDAVEKTFSPSASETAFLGGAKVANATITGATSASETLTDFADDAAVGTPAAADGADNGKMTISFTFDGYGYGSTSATTVKLLYSTDPSLAGATEVTVASGVSAALPNTVSTTLTGLPQKTGYFAKVVVTGSNGVTAEYPFAFTVRPNADTFIWTNAAGGDWENPENWQQNGAAATECPGAYDTVKFDKDAAACAKGTYTIRLNGDVDIKTLYFYPKDLSEPTTVTVDLQGHALHATTEINARSATTFSRRTLLAFTNGVVSCDCGFSAWNKAEGFNVDRESGNVYEAGHLLVSGPMTIGLGGRMQIAGNRSTARFENGVTFGENAGGNLHNNGGASTLVLTGAETAYHATNHSFLVGGSGCTSVVERAASVISSTCEIGLGGTLIVDDSDYCVLNAALYSTGARIGYSSGAAGRLARLIVRNNAQAVLRTTAYVGYSNTPANLSSDSELHVESGARLECASVVLGTRDGSWGNKLFVDDATLVTTNITIGGTANVTTNGVMEISGPRARVELRTAHAATPKTALAANYGSTIRFSIPTNGFDRTPVSAVEGKFATADCTTGPVDLRNRIVISADAFARAHPDTTIGLMTFGADSTAGFSELLDNYSYEGKERYKGTLSVSDDGKTLFYTTPKAQGMILLLR